MDSAKFNDILQLAIQQEASDVHLVADKPPIFRIHGIMTRTPLSVIPPNEMKTMLLSILTDNQKKVLQETKELDFSYTGIEQYQFRVNLHGEKGCLAATIRIINNSISSLEELGLPNAINDLVNKKKGLILLCGTAGSGKTTTLTKMIDMINMQRQCKIITIEDPIEYIHESKKSLVIQREVNQDTHSFANALKYSLRQDPDVVVVGEMRDLESISMALTTAETGHLVMSTIHAPDATEAINRIIDVFNPAKQDQILLQLSENLLAIIAQVLIPNVEGTKRVLATEVLLSTLPIRNLIRRKSSFSEIRSQMDAIGPSGNTNMYTLEKCLSNMAKKGVITKEAAIEHAKHPESLDLE